MKHCLRVLRSPPPGPHIRQTSLVDCTDTRYTIEQSSVRNKYEAPDAEGETVLRGDHKMFEWEDGFQFTDAEDRSVIAEMNSREAIVTLAPTVLPIGGPIPHTYEIADESGKRVGSGEGQPSP